MSLRKSVQKYSIIMNTLFVFLQTIISYISGTYLDPVGCLLNVFIIWISLKTLKQS